MTPREKILSLGVAAAVAIVGVSYGWSSVRKGFEEKEDRITQLQKQVATRDLEIIEGLMDRNKLNAATKMSLPSKSEHAVADYHEWLIELLAQAKLASPSQNLIGDSYDTGVMRKFKFQISGRGTLENLTNLLYLYHQKNYLHRIEKLSVTLVPREPYQLDIVLVSDVLALDAASETQAAPSHPSHRVKKSLEAYASEIVGRNLFSPANHPPRWSDTASIEAVRGSPFNFDPGAQETDAGQKVSYEIVGEAPEGLRIAGNGNAIDWIPDKVGTYVVTLKATDNGLPRQSSEQKLTIRVVDPPPVVEVKPEPKMDVASQAEISFLGSGRNGPEAWIRSKLEGKTIQLKEGDKLTLGSVDGTVIKIGANYVELETGDKKWTVGLDESLADAFRRIKVD